ncbi:oxygenase MpaB family protein [Nakamurella sp. A5-74]|uniref:Oxygenase MpaB family protein n=1 Tax=Nakamurella sp. A5-74 TaxID=3158264 RepID=A0AAU8DSE8_9ACTN
MTPDILAPLAPLRRALAKSLRDRVAGADAEERARTIWGSAGPRWFTPEDPIWRVHADASMFVGGVRALLLQSLHPLAMAGVAGHSGFRGDPWGRLERTSRFLATTTFGIIAHAEAEIAKVTGVHRAVVGRADDGRPYSANDPHLLEWVHIAEVDSFLCTYQQFGGTALTAAEADRYVEQSAIVAGKLGVRNPPTTVAQLHARMAAYRPELRATAACRDAAKFLLLDPPLPVASRPGYGLLAAGAIATLPGWARRELRLPPPMVLWDAPGRLLGRVGAGVVRWAMSDPSVANRREPGTAA